MVSMCDPLVVMVFHRHNEAHLSRRWYGCYLAVPAVRLRCVLVARNAEREPKGADSPFKGQLLRAKYSPSVSCVAQAIRQR
jgi:hypothetical protein